ncbi:hypothetical protein BD324DRAFT_222070 [Kockovaella imperatae]|uniref:EamA domain-containing protein n=1 Tax=Kockovaella imperatae TaxID=4999 RepID=A0A1Y1UQ11_9TREE|nr:hypothetical protein BD324DRAFT_222070 [Kockovaella imperatae]ORX39594.1 hypothetical protein BD324DRAFT_222070 [Kockovaella imperatae]
MSDTKTARRASLLDRSLSHHSAPVHLILLSDMGFTTMDGLVQLLQLRGVEASEVFLYRMSINAVICFAIMALRDPQSFKLFYGPDAPWLLARAVCSCGATSLAYVAVSHIPLSLFMTLYHLRPFPTIFACYAILGEKATRAQLIASVISFSAIIIVVQPDFLFSRHRPEGDTTAWSTYVGVGVTLLSCTCGALEIVASRKMADTVGWVPMLFAYTALGTVTAPVWILYSGASIKVFDQAGSVPMALWVGLCGMLAQATMILGLQRATGARVAVLGYFQILWAVLWQVVVYANIPNLLQILGTIIIIVAGCWAIVHARRLGSSHGEGLRR